jgi:hypothetical protein
MRERERERERERDAALQISLSVPNFVKVSRINSYQHFKKNLLLFQPRIEDLKPCPDFMSALGGLLSPDKSDLT